MGRLFCQLRELIAEFITAMKDVFYDSYTGVKKKSVAIASCTCVALVILLRVFVRVVPNGELVKVVSEGVTSTVGDLLPEKWVQALNQVSGEKGEYELFEYPNVKDTSSVVEREKNWSLTYSVVEGEDEWVWDGSWGAPTLGDIQSTSGEEQEKKEKKTKKEKNQESLISTTGRYGNWSTIGELENTALSVTQTIQDTILLQINNENVYRTWTSYVESARSTLVDIKVLGDQIRSNMSEDIVKVWDELEAVYGKLYEDFYACESKSDLNKIAVSDTYKEALTITSEFTLAINTERETSE